MENIILTVHLIIALCLIGIVLIQRSEGGGLGVGGGGGGAATSGRPGITALGKLTWVFGIAFVITSITLTILAASNANSGSVLDGAVISAPAEGDTSTGNALLPPTLPATGDSPLAPPRVDE